MFSSPPLLLASLASYISCCLSQKCLVLGSREFCQNKRGGVVALVHLPCIIRVKRHIRCDFCILAKGPKTSFIVIIRIGHPCSLPLRSGRPRNLATWSKFCRELFPSFERAFQERYEGSS
ncbi:hypothetical protein BDZ97DRAFT_1838099 [Flammula alnicola]|nr:hypothetical protein BDZ97DRAFT_1838099 [Flammula alnicola]